jgi:hypothetical protein
MADTSKFWLHNEERQYALVTSEAARDRLLVDGWKQGDEPADGWVHIWREGIEQPGLVPVSALETLWGPIGWVAGPPPGGVHPATEAPHADKPAESKPDSKPAAGGTEKGK